MILSYARVSTDEQAKDGTTSLSEQERKNKAIAQLRGADPFDVVSYVDRGVSGSIPLSQRPEGARLLADCKPHDVIVAAKLDRLFRSAVDALQTVEVLRKQKVDIILVDIGTEPVNGNGTAKLFFSMLSVFAEFERHRIAERMEDGRRAKKAQGMRISGHAPYGTRFEGAKPHTRLVPNEDEITIIREAAQIWKQTSPAIATDMLNEKGYRDRAGQPFRIFQMKRLVARAKELQQ